MTIGFDGYDRRKRSKRTFVLREVAPSDVGQGSIYKMREYNSHMVRDVRVTSVKTWKRRPEVRVRVKYGLYDYFEVVSTDGLNWDNEPLLDVARQADIASEDVNRSFIDLVAMVYAASED